MQPTPTSPTMSLIMHFQFWCTLCHYFWTSAIFSPIICCFLVHSLRWHPLMSSETYKPQPPLHCTSRLIGNLEFASTSFNNGWSSILRIYVHRIHRLPMRCGAGLTSAGCSWQCVAPIEVVPSRRIWVLPPCNRELLLTKQMTSSSLLGIIMALTVTTFEYPGFAPMSKSSKCAHHSRGRWWMTFKRDWCWNDDQRHHVRLGRRWQRHHGRRLES